MVSDIHDILYSKLSGEQLTPEEERLFEVWYSKPGHQHQYDELQKLQALIRANYTGQNINTQQAWRELKRHIIPISPFHRMLYYAAIALLILGIGITIYLFEYPEKPKIEMSQTQQIPQPLKKQIVLTLSNGEQLPLGDTLFQVLKNEEGVVINNNTPKTLVYHATGEANTPGTNTITIPRGGEYLLILADGTKIWLNSESILHYPVVFAGTQREVYLQGEAYFEVAQNPAQPFIVHTPQFDIRVTGTQFNVRTYADDYASTTLVKGKVQVEQKGKIYPLQPGQQSRLIEGHLETRTVDPEEIVAWRQEAFCFKDRRLENILNELSRWYDLDIVYQQTAIKNYHFTAWFHRSNSIQEVITILEKTHKIKMHLNGKTLTVRNNSN